MRNVGKVSAVNNTTTILDCWYMWLEVHEQTVCQSHGIYVDLEGVFLVCFTLLLLLLLFPPLFFVKFF